MPLNGGAAAAQTETEAHPKKGGTGEKSAQLVTNQTWTLQGIVGAAVLI